MVLCDLDGTIVHSARRVSVQEQAAAIVVERYDDRDVGFMSAEAWDLLGRLQERTCFVPATARTTGQYRRIRFPRPVPVAVVACGTVVLVDGEPDPTWAAEVDRRTAACGVDAAGVAAEMASLDVAEAPRVGDDRFAYVKVRPGDGAGVAAFDAWCAERGWRTVHQDGRLYALPVDLSKQSAVARAAELCGAEPVLALGDGLMDAELLTAATHALAPAESHLWRSGWRAGTSVDGLGLAGTEALLHAALRLLPPLVGAAALTEPPTP